MAAGEIYSATLWCILDKFYVTTDITPDQILSIDRTTFAIEVVTSSHTSVANLVGSGGSPKPIVGLLGIIQLVSGPHLIVATKKDKVGHITTENHAIWRLVESELIPFSKSELHLSPRQLKFLKRQRLMIKELLQTPVFYFSYTYDLTNSQQRLASFHYAAHNNRSKSAAENQKHYRTPSSCMSTLNSTFAWNYNILRPFLGKVDHLAYCIAVIHGALFNQHCSINGKHFRWTLISRRSTKRAGTRFFRRGCDSNGNVANFVETEQICEHGEHGLASFVQTRGSIPFYWTQEPDPLIYMPTPQIQIGSDHPKGFASHIKEQIQYYGEQMIVNLINHTKSEGILQRAFHSLCKESGIDGIYYDAFDFHQECSKFRWDNLKHLISRLKKPMERFGYFYKKVTKDPTQPPSSYLAPPSLPNIETTQSGVFRTNCMDCLDRTNVVQSMLANENLDQVLAKFGVLKGEFDTSEAHPDFQRLFRSTWADHANLLSLQYAGSGALKTDFTRTGKRTYAGLFEDLQNALIRYFKNNFQDGFRQDSIDLFLGSTTVPMDNMDPETASTFELNGKQAWIYYLPLVLLANISILLLTYLLSPALLGPEAEFDTLLFVIFLISLLIFTSSVIRRHSHIYVDRPRFTR